MMPVDTLMAQLRRRMELEEMQAELTDESALRRLLRELDDFQRRTWFVPKELKRAIALAAKLADEPHTGRAVETLLRNREVIDA